MKLKKLCLHLDDLLPSEKLVDYGLNGLQVEGKEHVIKAATAVSASLETIEYAIEIGVDALIVHHGLFWQRDSYAIQGVKKKKLLRLMQNEISLIAYHLPLDMHRELGNNWKAAREMGWSDLQPFGYFNGVPIGVQGTVLPSSQEDFQQKLQEYYQHSAVCALGGPKQIQTVALISGGAYKHLLDAAQAGVDAFVTGNFDEPAWYQAFEEKINFFALGHAATERIGPRALADYISNTLSLPCVFIDILNPF